MKKYAHTTTNTWCGARSEGFHPCDDETQTPSGPIARCGAYFDGYGPSDSQHLKILCPWGSCENEDCPHHCAAPRGAPSPNPKR